MNRLQPIFDIAELCAQKGITQAILCPGSRCAPLTIAFTQHPHITTKTISDERSAAFIALGIAQQTKQPTVLICTSGSAAYNFAPAIAEAYFQQRPLLILTADRPAEWIDQWDGQTIYQPNLFSSHVKKSFNLPADYEHPDAQWYINRTINEAINASNEYPQGPVHVNIPLREPLYPPLEEGVRFTAQLRTISQSHTSNDSLVQQFEFKKSMLRFTKIILLVGQHDADNELIRVIEEFSTKYSIPVIGDVISNFHASPQTIRWADLILGQCPIETTHSLQPELLITLGKSIISKNTKNFLRTFKPIAHWHIQSAGNVPDTFQALSQVIRTDPKLFFKYQLDEKLLPDINFQTRETYSQLWYREEKRVKYAAQHFFNQIHFSELNLLNDIIQTLPPRCNLQLANSMAVRYVNMIGLTPDQAGVQVFANRGTSGIDGCTSTAVGNAFTSDIPTILITGDIAFFYDRNAFWHNYKIPNLHIILINNQGGIIFNLIDGPANFLHLKEYFATHQPLTAQHLTSEFNMDYIVLDSSQKKEKAVDNFFKFEQTTKVLELKSNSLVAQQAYLQFHTQIKTSYDTKI